MKLEKGKYITVVSWGYGRHFLTGPLTNKLTGTCSYARIQAARLNKEKSPKAPQARVSVLRIVEVYDGKG
jgi:hypothetical protein